MPARPFGPKVGLELWRCATLRLGENPFVNELYCQIWRHAHQNVEVTPDRCSVQPRTSERGAGQAKPPFTFDRGCISRIGQEISRIDACGRKRGAVVGGIMTLCHPSDPGELDTYHIGSVIGGAVAYECLNNCGLRTAAGTWIIHY